MHGACTRHGIIRVRTLRCNYGVSFPSLRHKAEKADQRGPKSGAAEFARPAPVRTGHCIGRVLIVVHRKHWYEDVQVGRVFDASAGWVLRGLSYGLANWGLHFVWVRLCQNSVEIEIHRRLIDTVEVLQVGKCHQTIVSESVGLILRELC